MCRFKEKETEELKQQLQSEKASRKVAAEGDPYSEEQQLREEKKDLQHRYDEEKCRSASFELQVCLCLILLPRSCKSPSR